MNGVKTKKTDWLFRQQMKQSQTKASSPLAVQLARSSTPTSKTFLSSMADQAFEIYESYVTEKQTLPQKAAHLTAFAHRKGIKLRFVDAKKVIANPPKVKVPSKKKEDDEKEVSKDNANNVPFILKKQTSRTINTTVVRLMREYSTKSIKVTLTPKSKGKYDELTKIYNDYVSEKKEKPANKYDLAQYMKDKGIDTIEHAEISNFFAKYHSDEKAADADYRSDTETSVESQDLVYKGDKNGNYKKDDIMHCPPPADASMLVQSKNDANESTL